jgi:hypothetical protein
MRVQLVITVESVSELHRPRWEDHPVRSRQRELHVGFDGANGQRFHLILATEAATELFELMSAIMSKERDSIDQT